MIRKAAPADGPDLNRLMHESNGYEAPALRAMITAYRFDPTGGEDEEAWVLRDGAGIAGFYRLTPWGADQELDLFFTANDRQGRGVGRRLFAHMAERARTLGARQVLIVSNPAAADFYRRMGAKDDGVAPAGTGGITWSRPRLRLALA